MNKTCGNCGHNTKCVDSDLMYCQIFNLKVTSKDECGRDDHFFEKHDSEVYCVDCVNHIEAFSRELSGIGQFCEIKKSLITNKPLPCSEIRGNMYLCGKGGKEYKSKQDGFDLDTGLRINDTADK